MQVQFIHFVKQLRVTECKNARSHSYPISIQNQSYSKKTTEDIAPNTVAVQDINDVTNQRSFLENVAIQLKVKELSDWYTVSKTVQQNYSLL
jgi:hypothetical protein